MGKAVSIEDHFERIEQVVEELERGELPLERALERYEAGLRSVREARRLLSGFEAKLTELRAGADGDVAAGDEA